MDPEDAYHQLKKNVSHHNLGHSYKDIGLPQVGVRHQGPYLARQEEVQPRGHQPSQMMDLAGAALRTEEEAESLASQHLNETIRHEEVEKVQDLAQHGAKYRTEVND
jgi:hypothetical protein